MRYAGGTFSGVKSILIAREFLVIGHRCTPEGRLPDQSRVKAITNWGPCQSLSDVRAFLGTIGVCRIFIKNFAHRADALVRLTRKDVSFEWGPEQEKAQIDLKQALLEGPALRAIDYDSAAPVVLAVDTSFIAVGYLLCQCDLDNVRKRYYNRFGSITLNDREHRFSQPKLEIYGLFRALRALRLYLIGVRNLVIEVDARSIKGMLANPDIAPSASLNRWIVAILTFHFTLIHVPGTLHGPDGLSRRPLQPGEELEEDDDGFDDWIDNLYSFVHMVQPHRLSPRPYPSRPRLEPALVLALTEDGQDLSNGEVIKEVSTENTVPDELEDYSFVPRRDKTRKLEARLEDVRRFLEKLEKPPRLTDHAFDAFYKYATQFFIHDGRLWRKDPQGAHKIVLEQGQRLRALRELHDKIGHRGVHATVAAVKERFWWPEYKMDVTWYVRSCHLCQTRQMQQILAPPVVPQPGGCFVTAHVDSFFLPPSNGYKVVCSARCATIAWPEGRRLRRETAKALGDWLFEDILCRWGTLVEIISDNGTPWIKALQYLSEKYHINHIRISGYNSRANGIVERSHLDMRQALFKAADGNQAKWANAFHSVLWAERITTRKRMGCSPYFAATGAHPVLPLDIIEATYLVPPPTRMLDTTELIAQRAIALQKRRDQVSRIRSKVYEARREAARRFESDHRYTIRDFNFQRGDLVLIRNTAIEKSLNRKMRPRYTGPMVVVARNRGGAYLIAELDGTVLDRPIAAFRVVPYLARRSIQIDLDRLDIPRSRLEELETSDDLGDDDEGEVTDAETEGELADLDMDFYDIYGLRTTMPDQTPFEDTGPFFEHVEESNTRQ